MPKPHPPYLQEFKDEAVCLVLLGESSLAQVARNLGVSSNALSDWKKMYLNALMESFMATLKTEWVHHRHDVTRAQARRGLFDYMEVFCNRQRLHSALGYVSPVQFEAQCARQ